jgi:hypothetical protein
VPEAWLSHVSNLNDVPDQQLQSQTWNPIKLEANPLPTPHSKSPSPDIPVVLVGLPPSKEDVDAGVN